MLKQSLWYLCKYYGQSKANEAGLFYWRALKLKSGLHCFTNNQGQRSNLHVAKTYLKILNLRLWLRNATRLMSPKQLLCRREYMLPQRLTLPRLKVTRTISNSQSTWKAVNYDHKTTTDKFQVAIAGHYFFRIGEALEQLRGFTQMCIRGDRNEMLVRQHRQVKGISQWCDKVRAEKQEATLCITMQRHVLKKRLVKALNVWCMWFEQVDCRMVAIAGYYFFHISSAFEHLRVYMLSNMREDRNEMSARQHRRVKGIWQWYDSMS